jgi:16S rRNA (uracil1498-N3)-methyltransferase
VVERDARPPVATFYCASPLVSGDSVELSDTAAHHARVKRLKVGDAVQLTDGRGSVAIGDLSSLDKRRATVSIQSVGQVSASPAIHVRVPIGDRDRMLLLAEKAAELGVASWQAVRFRRSMSVSPRGEGGAFAAKIEARMISALEQSGGAWLPRRLSDCGVENIDAESGASRILLDRDGEPVLRVADAAPTTLLFGPEGGLEPDEREVLKANGWRLARLAEATLRFETAGIAAIAVVRAAQLANL